MKLVKNLLLCMTISLLTACGGSIETNMSEQMEDFTFITQDEEQLSLADLKGDWWLAYFSYTNCTKVCPRTTANMVAIQNKLQENDLHPHIISFNVDPDNDGPKELQAYAEKHEVDLSSWDFLTGYDFKTIQALSQKAFRSGLEQGAIGQISHSYMFYLIDPDGQVVKQYDGMGKEDFNLLIDDVQTVLQ